MQIVEILRGEAETELGPHLRGNVFAPHVHRTGDGYRMWYGGQGADGHDRIHYATSADGVAWDRHGVVLEHPDDNLINDPFVIVHDRVHHLFYTVAHEWIIDTIHHATSPDGITWTPHGEIVGPGGPDEWDGLLVGRPSVLVDEDGWTMWFDGRRDLPHGWTQDGRWPGASDSKRSVGVATSPDGYTWTKHPSNPVLGEQSGSVHVVIHAGEFLMLIEGRRGTSLAAGPDGIVWEHQGLWIPASGGGADRYGHVTPFLLMDGVRPEAVYMGLAAAPDWTCNSIGRVEGVSIPAANL